MKKRLFDSERKVMEVLWKNGPMRAGQIVAILRDEIGWNKNTTYTVIKKCIEKEVIQREEPHFMCYPLISRKEAQCFETRDLVNRMFDGSKMEFLSAFFSDNSLSPGEVEELKSMISKQSNS